MTGHDEPSWDDGTEARHEAQPGRRVVHYEVVVFCADYEESVPEPEEVKGAVENIAGVQEAIVHRTKGPHECF